jgi:hypothetical protein
MGSVFYYWRELAHALQFGASIYGLFHSAHDAHRERLSGRDRGLQG